MHIRVSTNNTAVSTYLAFLEGVEKHGCPLMVRTDHGKENHLIWLAMIRARGADHVITGDSRRNTRVERMHGEVRRYVMNSYMEFFKWLEENHFMSIDSKLDKFILHYLFLNRIQYELGKFPYNIFILIYACIPVCIYHMVVSY